MKMYRAYTYGQVPDVHEFPDCSWNGHTRTNSEYQAVFLHLLEQGYAGISQHNTLYTLSARYPQTIHSIQYCHAYSHGS